MKDQRRNPTPSRIYQPLKLDLATTPKGASKLERSGDGRGERRDGSAGGLHLDGALGAEVGLEHVLEALGGVDVHVQRRRLVEHLGVRIEHAERHGCRLASLACSPWRSRRRPRRRRGVGKEARGEWGWEGGREAEREQ